MIKNTGKIPNLHLSCLSLEFSDYKAVVFSENSESMFLFFSMIINVSRNDLLGTA